MYVKKVKYKNSLGELFFDNRTLYCEQIDMTGNSVRTVSEQLMNAHGSVTVSTYLNAKAIPCTFKLVDYDENADFHDYIVFVFNPLVIGTLTVYTEHNTYSIDCRPSEMPSIVRTDIPYIYSWNVDFIADFPLWRRGFQKSIPLTAYTTYANCQTFPNTPVEIYFPPNTGNQFNINGNGFSVSTEHQIGISVDTKNYTAVGTDGNDYSNLLSVDNIGNCTLQNGQNTIRCDDWNKDVILKYYALSLGGF